VPPLESATDRSRDLERLLTFVDAIAAVAITLLVLPLVDLAGEIHSEHQSVADLLRANGDLFWSFGLSFAVIARLWLAQHVLMRPVIQSSRALVTWLILWTVAIVFLPFPTALLKTGGDQAVTKVLYIGTLAASSICLAVLAWVIRRNPALHEPGQPPSPLAGLVNTALFLLALVLALVIPRLSYFPLILLVAADRITASLRRLRWFRSR
jgi:TMEM175 potassium channel family protein